MSLGGSSGRLPSVMGHKFSMVPAADIQRSVFNRSHGYKTTMNEGDLVPFFVDDVLPGDTFNLKVTTFARLSTPIVPVMDNMFADVFFFFVPDRLVWDNFKKMMGEQANPGDSTVFLRPVMDAPAVTGHVVGSLADYFGIPTGIPALRHGSAPFRCYNLIWNEWFRDENLQNSATVDKDDGPDSPADYVLRKRGKRHDYFTSCLPFAQKGTAVTVPLGSTAPVVTNNQIVRWKGIGSVGDFADNRNIWDTNLGLTPNSIGAGVSSGDFVGFGAESGLQVDLNTATAATINSLRQAFQIQRLYERDARGGTRYTELVRSHFGVVSPDARLQRPELLGTGSTAITFTPIPKTGSTDATSPQGGLAAFATFSHGGAGFVKSFTEHGWVIGLISIRADLNYQQGLARMWSRRSRWDHYWPALAHLGEQAVLNKEIYSQGPAVVNGSGTPVDDDAFGYQERFAEYRYKPSVITGQFRSTYATPLDMWHLAQKFTALPALDATFIQEAPPVSRVVAVVDKPHFYLDAYFDLKCARPMPTYSVPGMIDHF